MSTLSQKPVFLCGPYRIDVMKRRLSIDGEAVTVTAKAFDILVMLICRAGEVVTKDELLDAVWVDTVVEENNLTQQISALRKVFGERARDHKFIVTIPGRGYCFVAPVREVPADSEETPPSRVRSSDLPSIGQRSRDVLFEPGALLGTGLGAAYVFVIFFAVIMFDSRTAGPPRFRPQSVSVLTFRSLGADDDRFGTGIRDTLRAKLGNLDDLTVRPSGADLAGADAVDLGRRMNVDVVLAGSVQRDRDRIRVAVEMVDVRQERIVWGKTFDENVSNFFALQDTIAAEVVRTLREPRLSGSVPERKNAPFGTSLGRSGNSAVSVSSAIFQDRRHTPLSRQFS